MRPVYEMQIDRVNLPCAPVPGCSVQCTQGAHLQPLHSDAPDLNMTITRTHLMTHHVCTGPETQCVTHDAASAGRAHSSDASVVTSPETPRVAPPTLDTPSVHQAVASVTHSACTGREQ